MKISGILALITTVILVFSLITNSQARANDALDLLNTHLQEQEDDDGFPVPFNNAAKRSPRISSRVASASLSRSNGKVTMNVFSLFAALSGAYARSGDGVSGAFSRPAADIGTAGSPSAGTSLYPNNAPGAASSNPGGIGPLNVPNYSQGRVGAGANGGRYCGPTSVKMVLDSPMFNRSGRKHDVNDIGRRVMTRNGASHQGMLNYIRRAGLKGSYLEYGQSIQWLKRRLSEGTPVLASVIGRYRIGGNSRNGHIVVVVGFTSKGEVIINDPADGGRVAVPASIFARAWRGRAAIVARP